MSRLVLPLALLLAGPAVAQSVVPVRPIPARAVLGPDDLAVAEAAHAGALRDPAEAVGLEARVALYPGRPIRPEDLAPPALVERNARITLVWRSGPLVITAEGRALGRAAAGEEVRVMNLASRTTVTARMGADGAAHVQP
ncbi:flagellar basal body P-ring formation chaperone FlgA [Rubellimicrobium sp. CFH 75288]|uniref:flagellar basal body P-ring formation chaperone FlgA n=1 Tax=Rubellimicrobium sp. CFH 75288 TaxID=2697034 RepID=UPI001412A0C2|nr:flagellar basal body P-ring formation chaperone FlgA [Rubellimicrobium sp. CFH 75288]NAZ37290.1 flagellar basal body P-ring formation protein FlgA [Rubellimicrobium sp. CFH 75288]